MLHWETISEQLKASLITLMKAEQLKDYRLVGGTALSLYLGHRMSVDIDLFADAEKYGTIDYAAIEVYLKDTFPFVSGDFGGDPAFGKSYLIGENPDNVVKLDIYYASESFVDDAQIIDNIRLASIQDIIAMKVDVIRRGGRKKDFWDLHELLPRFSIPEMIAIHAKAYQWTHDKALVRKNFINFKYADEDFDPICLKNKEWVFIKEDIEEAAAQS
ncbi:nucleotidyl transferase AbiEii/AbiGii toxin family protein [Mucilaginibacter sp. RS28]|uniref:Nucleotidyl transferase AbiEii/AbiGii toxin family protein n=1 Tax=Mucilaginibacter straminoryzae TaxID=2932774 RepID=A0A9X2B981_9SPHI|nr:nucleotidyl transferase AbiEii/AbiGii toxin family protein [Mucilaginibacter straminoryzae]MCJ8210344.1 nucleotidyl transferase AbiEii/AbiGii toxin family protein [Mucilaginibacter straminoryzae]